MPTVTFRSGVVVSVVLVAGALSSCSSQFDSSMENGCDALRSAADAYASGDRQTFETDIDVAMSLGGAVELSDSEGKEQQDEAGAAFIGAEALHIAAYEGVEYNDGELLWRGKELDSLRAQNLGAGLAACEGY